MQNWAYGLRLSVGRTKTENTRSREFDLLPNSVGQNEGAKSQIASGPWEPLGLYQQEKGGLPPGPSGAAAAFF